MTKLRNGRRSGYWLSAVILVMGLTSLGMLGGVNWAQRSVIQADYRLVRLVGEVQTHASLAHLWVEEMVEGDPIDRSEIAAHLRKAEEILETVEGMKRGGSGLLLLSSNLSDDERVAQYTAAAKKVLVRFRRISGEREKGYDAGEYVQIGSPIDQRYDRVFRGLLQNLQVLEGLLERRLALVEARSQLLFRGILVVWLGIVILSTLIIWNRERRRQEAEQALRRSEAQLLQAGEMEAAGRLSGGIAYDINNHLAAIAGQCDLVRMTDEVSESLNSRLEAITQAAAKSTNLIKRLLAFSGRQPVIPEVINLNGVMESLGELLAGLLGKDVELSFELDPDLGLALIDPSQLEQVVVNLVINAREAMVMGGQIQIATKNLDCGAGPERSGDDGERWIQLSVSDTGRGIPEEQRDVIFEPFFTTKNRVQGSGLGLSTVHDIVTQNGGSISVESEVSKGATFRVNLPRTPGEKRERGVAKSGARSESRARTGAAAILLVEDSDDVRRSTREILGEFGYGVTAAANAEKAIQLFDALDHPIDLLLTDVILRGMDGKKLADTLRENDPALRVLFVSGYPDDVVRKRGISRGEEAFLAKPFSARDLANKVSAVLDGEAGEPN